MTLVQYMINWWFYCTWALSLYSLVQNKRECRAGKLWGKRWNMHQIQMAVESTSCYGNVKIMQVRHYVIRRYLLKYLTFSPVLCDFQLQCCKLIQSSQVSKGHISSSGHPDIAGILRHVGSSLWFRVALLNNF